MTCTLGIDIGGSAIKFGLVNAEGLVPGSFRKAPHSGNDVVEVLTSTTRDIMSASADEIVAVGIGSPGYINAERTHVVYATNLQWHDFALVRTIENAVSLPTFLDGDANLAALAEAHRGAARSSHSALYVSLGTGIGVGVVLEGRIWHGAHGVAGDVGHMPIAGASTVCDCGRRNCWESVASARVLNARLTSVNATWPAALDESADASHIVDEWIDSLVAGMLPLMGLIDPEVVVIGGALTDGADELLNKLEPRLKSGLLSSDYVSMPRLALAQLRGHSGAIGAGIYAQQCLEGLS